MKTKIQKNKNEEMFINMKRSSKLIGLLCISITIIFGFVLRFNRFANFTALGHESAISAIRITDRNQRSAENPNSRQKHHSHHKPQFRGCDRQAGISFGMIGGKFVKDHTWEMIVMLEFNKLSGRPERCGGTIISNSLVLTAAHCCTGEEKVSVKMYFGYNPDRIKLDEAVNSIFTVVVPKTDWHIHEDYHPHPLLSHDLCIIDVVADIKQSAANSHYDADDVKSACLPNDSDRSIHKIKDCWAAGWGKTEDGTLSDILRSAYVTVYTNDECLEESNWSENNVRSDNFCAGQMKKDIQGKIVDTCGGDSGGPLICEIGGFDTLVGVTSFGPSICGSENLPGIYSNVTAQADWIKNKMITLSGKKLKSRKKPIVQFSERSGAESQFHIIVAHFVFSIIVLVI